jgi:hypothetical protein
MNTLKPDLKLLSQEYLLVHAFKKTVRYIRSHNWFADVLELDLATINFSPLLKRLQYSIARSARWKSERVRLVPAPKAGAWWIDEHGSWEPRPDSEGQATHAKLRPLAHVPLRDQVVATAIMMCLADRIETIQGDPHLDVRQSANRKRVISYGNRLFCDTRKSKTGDSILRHRWGSSKVYRSYFADYRTFVSRPEIVAVQIGERSNMKTVIVHSDLSKFYDRVRPPLLHKKLRALLSKNELPFFNFARRVLNWAWAKEDAHAAQEMTEVPEFGTLALPQGLVSSGFFANVVLLDFDDALRAAFDSDIGEAIVLRDAARYVDDLRFVVEVPSSYELNNVEAACHDWLEKTLQTTAPGLTANGDKTRAVAVHDSQRVLVLQSRRMRRIQETISGGFDANGGTQLLAALEGLFNTIGQFIETDENGTRWPLKAVPDVRDETVARFVAGRYRSTYRSLRPLLEDEIIRLSKTEPTDDDEPLDVGSAILTKDELDRQSQAFGLRLVEEWIRNPGNVRLLRVGLDLFPDSTVLESVVALLRPLITYSDLSKPQGIRKVAEYTLAELFRAGATETGLVSNLELLPRGIDIAQYQDLLRDYARELMEKEWEFLPWYTRQQILLFLAASSPVGIDVEKARKSLETQKYAALLAFLQGQPETDLDTWISHAILARQSYLDAKTAAKLIVPQLTSERIVELAELAPTVAEELLEENRRLRRLTEKTILDRLSLPRRQLTPNSTATSIPLVSESRQWNCRLRDEHSLVRFAHAWLEKRETETGLSPAAITVSFPAKEPFLIQFESPVQNSLFQAPGWCPEKLKWRFELGFVLRFVVTGQSDPTEMLRHPSWREHEHCYRPPSWHWRVRQYSLYNGRDGLGSEWLPLSDWVESFLTGLLHWPGAVPPPRPFEKITTIAQAKAMCLNRLGELEAMRGEASGLLMLAVTPRSVWSDSRKKSKPLRVCIAQLAVPEFRNGRPTAAFGPHDPELNDPATRHQYRRHLTAMLAGVDQMLRARATHLEDAGLDFLLLPELAVHPEDVRTRLLPFVRRHGCWVFTGLTYHRCHPGGPLVNSGLWIVPESSPTGGVSHSFYEQGKRHLAPEEVTHMGGAVQGYRTNQWLLRWRWSAISGNRPLVLSGSICYDATDLSLASDLKKRSDIFAISALNRDVGTFDRMTDAIHYHMYQMVILANHAHFGGSNAYVPYGEQYHKQVFHLHGQDEAIVAFLEIRDPADLVNRGNAAPETKTTRRWKTPPADWSPPGG